MKVLEVNRALLGRKNQCRQLINLLPEIKGVGFDALYLLPVLEKGEYKASGSPYCIRDFWALDQDFGTAEDWQDFQKSCADLDLEIWVDWVMNHTAWDHPWIQLFPDRYLRENLEIQHPPETNWTDVAQLNFNHDTVVYFAELAHQWISKRGVTGFRCDASYRIPYSTWELFFEQVGSFKKDARWLADQSFLRMEELGFDGRFSDESIQLDSRLWNKIYDHDRSAFGELFNERDQQRLLQMKRSESADLNWLVGMGMMFPDERVSFFENQDFDREKWANWLKQF